MFAKSEIALSLLLPIVFVQSARGQQSASDVLIQRARTLDGQGRHDLAAAAWKQVLLLNPSQPDALVALASYYRSTGDTATADHYLALLRKVSPSDAKAVQVPAAPGAAGNNSEFEAAAKLAAQHRYHESLELYRKAFHGAVPSGTWAVSYYETEAAIPTELSQAIAGLRGLVKEYPANPSYQLALGRVLTYDARTRVEGIHLLADLHGTAEQMEQARIAWRQAIVWGINGPAAETAKDYLARYPDDQLAARLQSSQAEHVSHPVVPGQAEQGAAYEALKKGDLPQAQHGFESLLSIPAQRGKALAGLGYIDMQQKNFAAAQDHFEQAESNGFHAPELSTALVDARYWKAMQDGNRALDNDEFAHALSAFDEAHAIKPNAPEAIQGEAGVWMQQKQPERALPLFEQAVKMEEDRPQAWIAWFDAMVRTSRSREVIADQPYITVDTLTKLESDPDYMAVLAAAQLNTGNDPEGRRLMNQLAQVADIDKRSAAQLRCAELLAVNDPRASARLAFDVIRVKPDNLDAWKLLVSDEHIAGRDQMALTAADRMPAAVYKRAIQDVDFVTMLAAAHQAMGQYSTASNLLAEARNEASDDARKSNEIEAQTANLLLAEGNAQSAYKIYVKILRRSPNDSNAWNGIISALHQAKQDQDALTQIQQLPPEVAQKLEEDPGFLQTLAAVYGATGHNQTAVEMMGRVLAHYQPGRNDAPYAVEAQYAWLLLNAGDENQLAATLAQMGRRSDLTQGQKQQTRDIWAAWSIRKAAHEEKSGNTRQALAILETASQAFPSNGDIRRAMAGTYIRNNEGKLAFALYQQIDWTRATATDYAGAVAAAGAARQKDTGRKWLSDGLEQFPNDTELLTAAAQFEKDMGDTRKAAVYWRQVVANSSQIQLTQQLTGPGGTSAPAAVNASDKLARMLAPQQASDAVVAPAGQAEPLQDAITALPVIQHPISEADTGTGTSSGPDSSGQASPWLVRKSPPPVAQHTQPIAYQVSRWAVPVSDAPPEPIPAEFQPAAAPEVTYASFTSPAPRGAELAPGSALTTPSGPGAPPRAVMLGPAQQAQAELDGLASRYSAWLGGGTQVGSRSGQPGFDQLTRMEASFESSAVLGDSARVTVRALPVMLSAGAPDGTSNYNFGTSGAPLIGQSHFQSGVGGEIQLATRVMDGSLGFSPTTFYVSHLLGSLNFHPSNFPVNFRVYRDQVKETMLSYAGEKDPVTGQIWGGVVATGAEGGLSLGSAKEGFYLDGGAAQLTGTNVNRNSRIYGSTGAYWTVYSNPYGTLKMGANLTGLHYAQNQRYFTFGQGGYFSPDSYVLLNAPFTWESRPMNHVTYRINGSLGVQSFYEDTALPGSVIATDTTPTAQSNLGANYNLDANVAYRFDEHWYIGGFVGINNAHDYQDRLGGISVKYMQRPQVEVEGGATGLFDEHAIRPLIVP
ncbi:MAG TPA: cellulose synthase subunit BcsC-related outer membrane protein [Acidobacteriaceae bacterium]|nr:cellulose synthase subunit BcsC-related outer membrane protein [Acidobacteriaceae bacterium]